MNKEVTIDVCLKPKVDASKPVQSKLEELVSDLTEYLNEPIKEWGVNLKKVGSDAIEDTFSAIFSGEMDKINDIWDTAWQGMGDCAEKLWQGMLGKMSDSVYDVLTGKLSDMTLKPLGDWLTKEFGDVIEDAASALLSGWGDLKGLFGLSESASSTVEKGVGAAGAAGTASGVASTASSLFGGASSTSAALSALSAASGVGGLGTGLSAAYSAMLAGKDVATAVYLATGPASELAAIAEATAAFEAAASGATAASTGATAASSGGFSSWLSGLFGGSSTTGGSAGGAASAAGSAGLGAVGTIGILTAPVLIGAFLAAMHEQTPYTAADAQATANAGLGNLAAGEQIGATALAYLARDTGAGSLAAYAGWDVEDIRAMAAELGEAQLAMLDAQLAADELHMAVADLQNPFDVGSRSVDELVASIMDMGREMGLGDDTLGDLLASLNAGKISTEGFGQAIAAAAGLTEAYNATLLVTEYTLGDSREAVSGLSAEVANAGANMLTSAQAMGLFSTDATAASQDMRNLAVSLDGVSQAAIAAADAAMATDAFSNYQNALSATAADAASLVSQLNSVGAAAYNTSLLIENVEGSLAVGTILPSSYHSGGVAGYAAWPRFHDGLLSDEIPAILQRGEAVIRREAVNAQTLPTLRQINQTGQTPASGQNGGVNLHVEVHGNILGGGEGMEDLARIIDQRLRRLANGRYAS